MLLPIISVWKNYSGFQIQNGESKREPYDKNNRNQKKKNRKKKIWFERYQVKSIDDEPRSNDFYYLDWFDPMYRQWWINHYQEHVQRIVGFFFGWRMLTHPQSVTDSQQQNWIFFFFVLSNHCLMCVEAIFLNNPNEDNHYMFLGLFFVTQGKY